ncbi:hypothetical protein KSS87_004766 [Heliosperma pusillum]|nr:hypothetical protein KSS87_010848 [Heliosperma pusillum]KAH9617320.1 hypothetical protein KSS87_004766 [Heliosperma pusillum]
MTSTKIKGICKGSFKYISHLFVVKEPRELEIGLPTDVKHVAHIGWNTPDSTSPSWMNEFKAGSDMAVTSIGSIGGSNDPTWSSHDFEHTLRRQQSSAKLSNFPPANMPSNSDKQKRKKNRSSSSTPKTSSESSSRSSKHKKGLSNSEDGNRRQNSRR